MDNNIITPRKVTGFWELMPKEQMLFSSMLNKIEKCFQENCFVPLDTPVLEYSNALLAKSGGETDKQVFRFTKGDADVCLRYDLTVPLARFVSMHMNELSFPFKRYQIGKVYRGERPQKGRYREFYQCDADIIGNGELSLVADAECVNLFEKCFNALDLEIDVKVSNRKILSGFIAQIGKEDVSTDILIILDKLEKIPLDTAVSQLKELGLSDKECNSILKIAKTKGNIQEVATSLKSVCDNPLFQEGVQELIDLDDYLSNLGSTAVSYDLSIIRGHNYYTGTVFEGFLKGGHDAVGGGGRFENLCGYFSSQKMPGVGMSVGVTRLFDLLSNSGKFDNSQTSEIELAILPFDETLPAGLKVLSKLRSQNIKAECLYENKSFKSKMKEANRRQIKYVLIVGEDEVKTQRFTLKDMESGSQFSLSLEEIVEKLKNNQN